MVIDFFIKFFLVQVKIINILTKEQFLICCKNTKNMQSLMKKKSRF